MHIGGRAGTGSEILFGSREEITALRRFCIGEPREHGLQRLGDVARARNGIGRRTESRQREERKDADREGYERRTNGRGEPDGTTGDHLSKTSTRIRMPAGGSGRLLHVRKKS